MDVFNQFQNFVLLNRICRSEQVLNDLGRFCTSLIKKKFLLKEEFVLVLGHKKPFPNGFKHSVAVFDVFKRISIFVQFDRFGRL